MTKEKQLYTNPLSLSSLFVLCGLPLRLDSYKGCTFQCSYCYARARESIDLKTRVKPADPNFIERIFHSVFSSQHKRNLSVVGQFLEQRVPIHFGSMSDPFQPAEKVYKVTYNYLKALHKYSYPVAISTRGTLVAEAPYIDLLKDMENLVVQFSLSSTIDENSRVLEEDEVRPSILLKTMDRLSSAGVRVACRWQPYVLGLSESPEKYVQTVASAGAQHISFEHLKLPREVNQKQKLSDIFYKYTGKNIYKIYQELGSKNLVREYIIPANLRFERMLETRMVVRKAGITFGAADNDFQHFSDTACCCSGVDKFPGFENWFKHQVGHAVRKNRGKEITFSSISSEWTPKGSINRYLNSKARLPQQGNQIGALSEHIVKRWNSPGREGCPQFFYGVVPTEVKERSGTNVYTWREDILKHFQ